MSLCGKTYCDQLLIQISFVYSLGRRILQIFTIARGDCVEVDDADF